MRQPNLTRQPEQDLGLTLMDPEAYARLDDRDKALVHAIACRLHRTRSADQAWDSDASFGQRMADRVAAVGGSWAFVLSFLAVLGVWVAANWLVLPKVDRFDPYPFIFLNLLLSMLAAVQAPIIMMSQNRQSEKDRIAAQLDYEVNLKAEGDLIRLEARLEQIEMALAKTLSVRVAEDDRPAG